MYKNLLHIYPPYNSNNDSDNDTNNNANFTLDEQWNNS